MHWEEQRKAMQADMGNKAELARCADALLQAGAPQSASKHQGAMQMQCPCSVPASGLTARHGAASTERCWQHT